MTSTPLALPDQSADWLQFVSTRCNDNLNRSRALVAQLKDGTPRDTEQTLELVNQLDIAMGNASSIAGLMSQVHPDAALRGQAEQHEIEISKLGTDIGLDRELYDVLAALDPAGLDPQSLRMLEKTLRDFRRSGVDHDEQTRQQLRELSEKLTRIGQEFSRNIRDDVRSITITAEQLAGMPQDFIDAHPADAQGRVTITTDYPDVIPFRTFATDRDARKQLTEQFLNRAYPANEALLHELLATRHRYAKLLGYSSWPDYDAEVKMVGSGQAIAEFIEKISANASAAADRDYQVLLTRLRQDVPGETTVYSYDSSYYAQVLRRENFDVDAQAVRTYFDFTKVRAGLLEVTARLFGIQYQPRTDAPVWAPEVTCYDVSIDNEVLGRIYLDLHPREGKYKHAAQFDLVSGVRDVQLPEGALVCNFSRALMEHSDVVTLFHEFGHLVHHILGGNQRFKRFSGVATEWDFVEAPSQMLEEWAWREEILASFATNAAGEPIPADMVAKLRAAKEFGEGYATRTQMFYAAISYWFHQEQPADLTAEVIELQRRYDLFGYIDGTHFHDSFGHLEGYTSAYYTYMWSLVIAKDLFSAFDGDSLFDTTISYRYRDTVLAPGGSKDAADLVADFLGRPYNYNAFTRWLES